MPWPLRRHLGHLLEHRKQPFAQAEAIQWGDQLLGALEYLHKQFPPVIHRDIKPQNLKLTGENEIILLDFGLAKSAPSQVSTVSSSDSIYGFTRGYASLEQIRGLGTDPRSDLYSLAATLYHLMTGQPPIDALIREDAIRNHQPDPLRPANELNPQVHPDVAALLKQVMALEPSHRHAV